MRESNQNRSGGGLGDGGGLLEAMDVGS